MSQTADTDHAAFAGPDAAIAMKAALESALQDAYHGCGSSDVLYSRRFSEYVERIAEDMPGHIAAIFLARAAAEYDYSTPAERDEQQAAIEAAGDCSLTGIDPMCCPCGRHE